MYTFSAKGRKWLKIFHLLYSLFTPRGFAKHGWIVLKWVATVICILIGTFSWGPGKKACRHSRTAWG